MLNKTPVCRSQRHRVKCLLAPLLTFLLVNNQLSSSLQLSQLDLPHSTPPPSDTLRVSCGKIIVPAAALAAGCGRWTRGRGPGHKKPEGLGEKEGSGGEARRRRTYLRRMFCLSMWSLEIFLQFSWQPASAPSQRSLLLSVSH